MFFVTSSAGKAGSVDRCWPRFGELVLSLSTDAHVREPSSVPALVEPSSRVGRSSRSSRSICLGPLAVDEVLFVAGLRIWTAARTVAFAGQVPSIVAPGTRSNILPAETDPRVVRERLSLTASRIRVVLHCETRSDGLSPNSPICAVASSSTSRVYPRPRSREQRETRMDRTRVLHPVGRRTAYWPPGLQLVSRTTIGWALRAAVEPVQPSGHRLVVGLIARRCCCTVVDRHLFGCRSRPGSTTSARSLARQIEIEVAVGFSHLPVDGDVPRLRAPHLYCQGCCPPASRSVRQEVRLPEPPSGTG